MRSEKLAVLHANQDRRSKISDTVAHQDNNFFSDLIQIKPATPKITHDQRNSKMFMQIISKSNIIFINNKITKDEDT